MTEEEKVGSGISRRTALKRIGAAGALAWTTPVIASLRTPAFAASPVPHPECEGSVCGSFASCSSSNPDCICTTSDQGGFCVPGSTPCAGLALCPGGASSECPSGQICLQNTCCGAGVCVTPDLTAACPATNAARPTSQRRPTGANTIGG